MATSRNRGRRKPKLRDLSLASPTPEESRTIRDSLPEADPIAAAIMGTAIVEHELDVLLRRRIPGVDDDTWADLLSDNGPYGTFSAKIRMGHALRIYGDETRQNLDVLRAIRNAFAHTKKPIDFGHELIIVELQKIRVPRKATRSIRAMYSLAKSARVEVQKHFSIFCFCLSLELAERNVGALKAEASRARRRADRLQRAIAQSPFSGYLSDLMALSAAYSRPGESPINALRPIQIPHTDDPSRAFPPQDRPKSDRPGAHSRRNERKE